jgi:GNAT superfamily N-acetyltransferase
MQPLNRNVVVNDKWILQQVNDISICQAFNCGNDDLNDYFHNEALLHKQELLTQTYCLQRSDFPDITFAILHVCNDSVHLEQYKRFVVLPREKQHLHMPAVKLTRLGVSKDYQRKNIGSKALNMLKEFFTNDNRTGCRLITVDAYNTPSVLKFYESNFFTLFSDTEKDRKKET